MAQTSGYQSIECYWFDISAETCIERNGKRPEAQRVPEIAIRGTAAKFVPPTKAEGFDRIWRISLGAEGNVVAEELP